MLRVGRIRLHLVPKNSGVLDKAKAILFVVACIYLNSIYLFTLPILTWVFHEFGHYIVCRYYKISVTEIRVSPFGGSVSCFGDISGESKFYTALMGPVIGTMPIFLSFILGFPDKLLEQILTITLLCLNTSCLIPIFSEESKSDGAIALEFLVKNLNLQCCAESYSERYSPYFFFGLFVFIYYPYVCVKIISFVS